MTYTYRLHPKAEKEYAAAYSWYEQQQSGLGEKFISAVRDKIFAIAAQPELYGSKLKGYREVVVNTTFPYVIVYKIYTQRKEIFITSIFHQKRNPSNKYRK